MRGPSRRLRVFLALMLGLSLAIPLVAAPASQAAPLPSGWTAGSEGWVWQSPQPQGNPICNIVAGDADHVWVTGDTCLSFSGTGWQRQTELLPETIWKTSAVDATHIWGLGGTANGGLVDRGSTIYFFDGTAWTLQAQVGPSLTDIFALDAQHVWAVGGPSITQNGYQILFFDGTHWQAQASFAQGELLSGVNVIWAADATHIWAGGSYVSAGKSEDHYWDSILSSDGSSWSVYWQDSGSGDGRQFSAMSGASSTDIWLGGWNSIMRYNGINWTEESSPYIFEDLKVADATHIWATNGFLILFNNGSAWSEYDLKLHTYGPVGLSVLDTTHVWVCDNRDAWFFDGTAWAKFPFMAEATPNLSDIEAFDSHHVWGLSFGRIFFFDGETWSQQFLPNDNNYVEVIKVTGPNDAWAATDYALYHFDGSGWSLLSQFPAGPSPRDLAVLDAQHIWMPNIYFFDGSSWTQQFPPPAADIRYAVQSLYAADASHVWAATYGGSIFFFDGTTWTEQLSDPTMPFYDIKGWGTNRVWAVGGKNVAYFFDGSTWQAQPIPASSCSRLAVSNHEVLATCSDFSTAATRLIELKGGVWRRVNVGTRKHLGTLARTDAGHVWTANNFVPELPATVLARFAPQPQPPSGFSHTYWMAEGYTGSSFAEWLTLANPGTVPAGVQILYCYPDGGWETDNLTVQPNSRCTVSVNSSVGHNREVSARIASNRPIIVERPEYFDYGGRSGGHVVSASPSLSNIWYFAEGYTGPGFDEYVCVFNPGASDTTLDFHFQTKQEGAKDLSGYAVPAGSRRTFRINDLLGAGYEASLALSSSQPVVAERAMYFDYGGWTGGSCVMGATSLSDSYYFAEGTTREGFAEYLTLQNPNPSPIDVTCTFQVNPADLASVVIKTFRVGALSRLTVFVPEWIGWGKDASVAVTSSSPFLAERPMYFDYTGYGANWTGGHCVIGTSAPASEWFFAEGCTLPGFHEYLCLQNPGDTDATVEITYLTQEAGALPVQTTVVPAHSRITSLVNVAAGEGYQLSCRVRVVSGPAIVAERPMYFDYNGWDGGHDALGVVPIP